MSAKSTPVAARLLTGLATATPLAAGVDDYALVDVDDTMIEVHGYGKAGSGSRTQSRLTPEEFKDKITKRLLPWSVTSVS